MGAQSLFLVWAVVQQLSARKVPPLLLLPRARLKAFYPRVSRQWRRRVTIEAAGRPPVNMLRVAYRIP